LRTRRLVLNYLGRERGIQWDPNKRLIPRSNRSCDHFLRPISLIVTLGQKTCYVNWEALEIALMFVSRVRHVECFTRNHPHYVSLSSLEDESGTRCLKVCKGLSRTKDVKESNMFFIVEYGWMVTATLLCISQRATGIYG